MQDSVHVDRDELLEILKEVEMQGVEYEAPHYLIIQFDRGLMAKIKAAIDSDRKS